jgi:hypothetical protein
MTAMGSFLSPAVSKFFREYFVKSLLTWRYANLRHGFDTKLVHQWSGHVVQLSHRISSTPQQSTTPCSVCHANRIRQCSAIAGETRS